MLKIIRKLDLCEKKTKGDQMQEITISKSMTLKEFKDTYLNRGDFYIFKSKLAEKLGITLNHYSQVWSKEPLRSRTVESIEILEDLANVKITWED